MTSLMPTMLGRSPILMLYRSSVSCLVAVISLVAALMTALMTAWASIPTLVTLSWWGILIAAVGRTV